MLVGKTGPFLSLCLLVCLLAVAVPQQPAAAADPVEHSALAQSARDRLRIDKRRCRDLAEVKVKLLVPVGTGREEVEVHLSERHDLYLQCMARAGWQLSRSDSDLKPETGLPPEPRR